METNDIGLDWYQELMDAIKRSQTEIGAWYEKYAINKYPRKGKCKNSCFMNGEHRVGTVPTMSLLDGGIAGDMYISVCLQCGKKFDNDGCFMVIDQPREIKK